MGSGDHTAPGHTDSRALGAEEDRWPGWRGWWWGRADLGMMGIVKWSDGGDM